jgi:hypothetical protein
MFFNKARSKKLASLSAKEFNGKVENVHASFGFFRTCHFRVKFKYKSMRIEAYFFYPFCEIWIQNFTYPYDINFTVGKPLPFLGQTTSLKDIFKDYKAPVFSNSAYDIEKAREFCKLSDNERDIEEVGLQKGEYLCIASGQIIIRNKNQSVKTIQDRIDILNNLFDRNRNMISNKSL